MASLTTGAGVATAGGGGTRVPDAPHLRDVTCMRTCAGMRKATEGSRVRAAGRHLGNVKEVRFRRKGGGHVSVTPLSVSGRSVKAKVPHGAASGRPKVVDRYQNRDTDPRKLRIVSPDRIPSDGGFKLEHAKANPRKAFYDGPHPARVTFTFQGTEPMDIRISVVHRKNGKVVDTWVRNGVEPNTAHKAHWRGGARDPIGKYRFKIGPASGGKGESTDGARFEYYRFKFPVRGRHTYGDGYGAPRGDHIHMGQDVAAACGTRLVAAHAGVIQYKAYQASGAGYYVVLDGKRDNHDYMYAHLRRPASVHQGEHVRTGEKIGVVGQTGDATGCHLHFEYWKDDWWNGGRALPRVTRVLKRWDRWS